MKGLDIIDFLETSLKEPGKPRDLVIVHKKLLKEIKRDLLILEIIMKNSSIEKQDIVVNYNKTPVIVKNSKYLKVDISEYGQSEELKRIKKWMEEYNESSNN